MSHLVIDPVTRVGGQLRVETSLRGGMVDDAWVSATMYRGIEQIIQGREPRDAWFVAQRVCGSCSGVHALASVRAVEDAFDIAIPTNARLIRNILAGTQLLLDHVSHFYGRQAFDWVDARNALDADPVATAALARSLGDWPKSNWGQFSIAKTRLGRLISDDRTGLYADAPWGHPAYRLAPEANLMIAAHHLEALDWVRSLGRLRTLLGGKDPHPQTWLVGGMAIAPPWGGPAPARGEHPRQIDRTSPPALGAAGLARLGRLLAEARAFVEGVFVPDIVALGREYADWASIGVGQQTYLAAGEFPEDNRPQPRLLLPRGRIIRGRLTTIDPVEPLELRESVAHSWYADDGIEPRYSGPALPFKTLADAERYSWMKAPRYGLEPAETGPLARVLVAFVEGRPEVREAMDRLVSALGAGPDVLTGTLGRLLARAIEAQVVAVRLEGWLEELRQNLATGDLAVADLSHWEDQAWASEAEGWSLGEGPAGAIAHQVHIRGGRIDQYRIVDGTTWNASPRCDGGRRGPLEEALRGITVADPTRPIEILRTIHAFDPCPTCGVH
jgi:hydrogenase large subunit